MMYAATLKQGEKATIIAYKKDDEAMRLYMMGLAPRRSIEIFSNQDGYLILYTSAYQGKIGIPREVASHLEVDVNKQ